MRLRRVRLIGPALACVASLGAPVADSLASHNSFQLVSSGNGTEPTQFVGASADGLRVLTRTEEAVTSTDTDTLFDVYEHAGGVTSQLSLGPAGGNGDVAVESGGAPRPRGRGCSSRRRSRW